MPTLFSARFPHRARRNRSLPARHTAAAAIAAALLGAASPVAAQDRVAEICRGTETTEAGGKISRSLYAVDFSADLKAGYVCYNRCTAAETFAIHTGQTNPITLADVDSPTQVRSTKFDRRTSLLIDHQVIRVLGEVRRNATATCRPTTYRQPTVARVEAGGGDR